MPVLIGTGVSAVVFAVLAAPSIARALTFFSQGKRLLGSSAGADVGNLISKLPFWEGFGVWLSDDFRLLPSGGDLTLTYRLVVWSRRSRCWASCPRCGAGHSGSP